MLTRSPGCHLFHDTDAFMPQHHAFFVAVIAGGNVQIGMAHAAIFHFHQRFAVCERADVPFNHFHKAVYFGIDNGSFHFCHDTVSFTYKAGWIKAHGLRTPR